MAPNTAPPAAPIPVPVNARCCVSLRPEHPARARQQARNMTIVDFISLAPPRSLATLAWVFLDHIAGDPIGGALRDHLRRSLRPLHEIGDRLVACRQRF